MYGLNVEYLKALSFLGFENPLDWSPSPWFVKSRCKNLMNGGGTWRTTERGTKNGKEL